MAYHFAFGGDDVAGGHGVGAQLGDDVGVAALGDEADVLAVGFGGDFEAEAGGVGADFGFAGAVAEGEQAGVELGLGGGEQEPALVAAVVDGAVEFGAVGAVDSLDVVAGGEAVGAEVGREFHQVGEFDRLVAGDAGDRGFAGCVAVGEGLDDGFAEALLGVDDVVGDAEVVGDAAGVVDVLAGATGAFAADG